MTACASQLEEDCAQLRTQVGSCTCVQWRSLRGLYNARRNALSRKGRRQSCRGTDEALLLQSQVTDQDAIIKHLQHELEAERQKVLRHARYLDSINTVSHCNHASIVVQACVLMAPA